MSGIPAEHARDVRAALRIVMSDPGHGAATLSSPQAMSNLLKDLLPEAPREKNLLVAAAEADLAGLMLDRVGQGIDARSAIRLAAASFAANTHFTDPACLWVTTELAIALDLAPDLAEERSELPAGDITTARSPAAASTAQTGPVALATLAEQADASREQVQVSQAGQVTASPAPAPPASAASRVRGRPAAARAVLVLGGAVLLAAGCAVPVYGGSPPGRIWGASASASWVIASGPTAALCVALAAGVLLAVSRSRRIEVAAAGAALACGVEALASYLAIYWQMIKNYGNPVGAGLVLGVVSAALLIAGGALTLLGRPGTEPAGA